MQITDTKFGPFDVNRQPDLTSFGQILDVTVAAMLWSAGNSTRALFLHLLLDLTFSATRMSMRRVRGQSNNALQIRGFDEFGLTFVPFCQDFCRRRASKLTGMDDARESDMRNVARCGVDSFKVPYSLGTALIVQHCGGHDTLLVESECTHA